MKIRLASALLFVACAAACAVPARAQIVRNTQVFKTSAGEVRITPIWHASTMIEANGKTMYLDPYSQGELMGLKPADFIIITHTHGDHMDPKAIAQLSKPSTIVWAPAVVAKTVTQAQIIANGETKKWDKWSIEAVPAYNIKNGHRHVKGEDNGYIMTYGGKRFYFSADTEATPEMKALKHIDVAFICMNAATMPPEEAAEGVKAFHPKIAIPYHYRGSDLNKFYNGLKGTGVEVRIIDYYPKDPYGRPTPQTGNPPPNSPAPAAPSTPAPPRW